MLTETQALWFTIGLFALCGFMLWQRGWWFLIQGTIVIAVVCSNIYFEWTPNKMLAGLVGVGLAALVTFTAIGVADLRARARAIAERRRDLRAGQSRRRPNHAADQRLSAPE